MIDPPSGWKYGFPRKYEGDKDGDMGEFLLHHGYPIDDIDFALRHMRCWKEENEQTPRS